MKLSKSVALIIGAATLIAGLSGCAELEELGIGVDTQATETVEFEAPAGSVAEAVNEIDTTRYEEDGSYSGNRVALYGSPWVDVDENGCDTRNDILQRDLEEVQVEADGCTVEGGVLLNPYSEEEIQFEKGQLVQIDHIIPLGYAHYAGAKDWTQDERIAYANDPENLLASKGSDNSSKRDSLPDEWLPNADEWNDASAPTADHLPEDTTIQCNYIADVTYVAVKYDLSLTQDSVDAMLTVLSTCPDQAF